VDHEQAELAGALEQHRHQALFLGFDLVEARQHLLAHEVLRGLRVEDVVVGEGGARELLVRADGRGEPGRSGNHGQYWLMTVTPRVTYLSIDSSTPLASSSGIFRCTSFPGFSRPRSTIWSIGAKCDACMPSEPRTWTSFRTMTSIGSAMSPFSAPEVRPTC